MPDAARDTDVTLHHPRSGCPHKPGDSVADSDVRVCHRAQQCHGREVIAVTVSVDLGGDGGCLNVQGNASFRTEGKWFGCFSVSA